MFAYLNNAVHIMGHTLKGANEWTTETKRKKEKNIRRKNMKEKNDEEEWEKGRVNNKKIAMKADNYTQFV